LQLDPTVRLVETPAGAVISMLEYVYKLVTIENSTMKSVVVYIVLSETASNLVQVTVPPDMSEERKLSESAEFVFVVAIKLLRA
jgi:hypothetical protein